ncbi:hypothetical protein [Paenibacillus maysiensis]|uniref:hypothetical protein n=1 Tax=Paenibacillus maysiensis TaxID=1155954 RepID=UPI000471D273|nr:hypothetical protein [Paenibacillus maysiensis]
MTDKPRLIDADKLERFLEEIGSLTARRIEITIAAGLFDPAPPQQPDIQVGELNWAEVSRGLYNDFVAAQSLIQQKDAEIARLKKSIEGLRLLHKATRTPQENTP